MRLINLPKITQLPQDRVRTGTGLGQDPEPPPTLGSVISILLPMVVPLQVKCLEACVSKWLPFNGEIIRRRRRRFYFLFFHIFIYYLIFFFTVSFFLASYFYVRAKVKRYVFTWCSCLAVLINDFKIFLRKYPVWSRPYLELLILNPRPYSLTHVGHAPNVLHFFPEHQHSLDIL